MSSSCLWQTIFRWPQPRQLNLGCFETIWCCVMLYKCSQFFSAAHWNNTSDLAQEEERLVDAAGFCNIFCASLPSGMHQAILCGSQSRHSQDETKLNGPCWFLISHKNNKIDLRTTDRQWICQCAINALYIYIYIISYHIISYYIILYTIFHIHVYYNVYIYIYRIG